ncbi:MAG: hypothetical protein ABGZ17_26185 [Planctomycetaceae bacterium]
MTILVEDLLLAAPDGMSVGLILFLIVSFVSWIYNLIKGNQGNAKTVMVEKLDQLQRRARTGGDQRRPRRSEKQQLDRVDWDEESQPQLQRRQADASQQVEQGSSVAEHVEQHMNSSSIAEHVEEYLDHDVNQSVSEHLGGQTSSNRETTGRQSGSISELRRMLRDPASIRKAIILSEVLMPPKALRVRR